MSLASWIDSLWMSLLLYKDLCCLDGLLAWLSTLVFVLGDDQRSCLALLEAVFIAAARSASLTLTS